MTGAPCPAWTSGTNLPVVEWRGDTNLAMQPGVFFSEIGMERGIILEIVTVDRIPGPHLGEDLVDFLEEIKETTDSLEAGQWVTAGLDQTQTGEGEDREETLKKDLLQNLSVDDQEAGNQKLDIATGAILRHIWVKTALVM